MKSTTAALVKIAGSGPRQQHPSRRRTPSHRTSQRLPQPLVAAPAAVTRISNPLEASCPCSPEALSSSSRRNYWIFEQEDVPAHQVLVSGMKLVEEIFSNP
ncbi:hypothetical protein PIB30_030741 [Stylosanthes scabra]|uniref:Uncharacterized protein n=1 Tax=Stylosanthes scabra TaxID=79078 RepID=A0ABU6W9Z6_9FABA|nr:hypothetical protein [Stylosanthes scabra]